MKPQLKDNRTVKSYSETFKLKVLEEISQGRLTKAEAVEKYAISYASIYNWMRKYGKLELYNPRIRIEMPEEKDKIKSLEKQIKELKEALVKTQLDHLYDAAHLEKALEKLGMSKEELEKKIKAKQSE